MAAPTSIATAEVLALAAGSATPIDGTNAANRQLVVITNNGPQPVTIVESSGAAPTITVGKGLVLQPGGSEWLWNGQGARIYAKVGPVPAGETEVDQVAGAALWVTEKV